MTSSLERTKPEISIKRFASIAIIQCALHILQQLYTCNSSASGAYPMSATNNWFHLLVPLFVSDVSARIAVDICRIAASLMPNVRLRLQFSTRSIYLFFFHTCQPATHAQERYKSLVSVTKPIESHLKRRLPDLLNAEIVLGTITNAVESLQHWVQCTYFYARHRHQPLECSHFIGKSGENEFIAQLRQLNSSCVSHIVYYWTHPTRMRIVVIGDWMGGTNIMLV